MVSKICLLDFDRTINKAHVLNDILVLNKGINPKKINPNKFALNASILFVDDEAQAFLLKKSDVELGALIVDFISINKGIFLAYEI